jgi:hypothetical protein
MKRAALLLLAAFSVAAIVAVGTRAIFTADSPPLPAIEARASNLSVTLDFAADPHVKGVPGEALPLTSRNSVIKESSGMGVAFRITYYADGSGENGIIKDLYLKDDAGLLKSSSQGDRAVYYGVVKEKEKTVRDLGALIIEFSAATQGTDANFEVNAEILACQLDEEAIKQTFGLNKDEIAALLN